MLYQEIISQELKKSGSSIQEAASKASGSGGDSASTTAATANVSSEQSDAVLAQSVADAAVVMSKTKEGQSLSGLDTNELVSQSNF